MNRLIRSLLPLGLAFATSALYAHEPAPPAATTADATASAPAADAPLAAAYAVVDRFAAALKAGDFDTARTLLAEDVVVLEMGGAERSREEYLAQHAVGDAAFLGGATVMPTRRTGRVEGSMAWIATESDIRPAGEGEKPLSSSETMVLRKEGSSWRIAHIHWSSRAKRVSP